jgi:hypothetical protein
MISHYLPSSDGQPSRQRLLETIEFLQKEGIDDSSFKILNALANGLIWSDESDRAVRDLGKQIAQGLYDHTTQNADFEARLTDPQNPQNW